MRDSADFVHIEIQEDLELQAVLDPLLVVVVAFLVRAYGDEILLHALHSWRGVESLHG